MQKYIFSYGSLRNPQSRARTLSGERPVTETTLRGYVKKFNTPVNGFLYLNIVPRRESSVRGTLIGISDDELELLKSREHGYECTSVDSLIQDPLLDSRIFAFIAPDKTFPNLKIPRSYINTCLAYLSEPEKTTWLLETIVENEIEEDANNPVYANAA